MGMLDGKVALITGGTRGIGKAIAIKFASEGATIVITALHEREESVKEIESFGKPVRFYLADASDFDTAHDVVNKVIAEFGKLDILVNNAGKSNDVFMLRLDEKGWDSVIDGNLKSTFNYTHAVAPLFGRQRSGCIINMASIVGLHGNQGQSNYAAAKAGIIGLTKSIAKEMGARNVRVNCIAPGYVVSDMTDAVPEEIVQRWIKDIPMKRGGTVDEVANVALFLASDLASYVTGQTIEVTGGMVC